jgi:hypothetical protein
MEQFSAEEFLNKKVKIIYDPMIAQILIDKPKEPVRICFNIDSIYD